MPSLDLAILGQIPPGSPLRVGRVDGLSPLTVALDGVPVAAINAGAGVLGVGELVLTASHGGTVWVQACLEPRPQTGTVASVASGLAVVTAGGRTYTGVPVRAGTATVGGSVLLLWGSEGVAAIAGGNTSAPGLPPSPLAPPEPVVTPAVMDVGRTEEALLDLRCSAVRTSRSGAYRSDGSTLIRAYQGYYADGSSAANSGWFFYGAFAAPGGTCLSASIRLARPRAVGTAGNVPMHLRLHTSAEPGSTPPALTADAEVTHSLAWGDNDAYPLPVEWGQKLLDGTARGVALAYSGTTHYAALSGPGETPLAGQILIRYLREVS